MAEEKPDIEPALRVGESAVLHLHPTKKWGPRYKAIIRGWYSKSHIVLDRPKVKERIVRLQPGDPCAVRFLSQGKAYGFNSTILDRDTRADKPSCLAAWPTEFEVISFRKFERVAVAVPCKLAVRDETCDGEVRDLSIGGCRICAPIRISVGDTIAISFTLPDGLPIDDLQASIRNVRPLKEGTFLGCQFLDGQEHVQSDMAFFVAAALERAALDKRPSLRVLIVDGNLRRVAALRLAFELRGWNVFTASTSVEGLLRLRMVPPTALLISKDQEDLLGVDVLRLLRSTRGIEALPMYAYGGDAAIAAEHARNAGLTGAFPDSCKAEAICNAVTAFVAPEPAG